MTLICVTCDQQFESVPKTAVQLTRSRGSAITYRFEDGAVHVLRKQTTFNDDKRARGAHSRWHLKKNIDKPDCKFCNPATGNKETT